MNDRSMAVLFSYAVRAWKATTPELNGHRPQIAGNRNAERGRFRKRKKSYAKRASMLEPSDTA